MEPDEIEISITVDRDEAASMTYGARQKWLGEIAEEKLSKVVPPRPPLNGGSQRNRWKPYTRDRIAQAFREWAALNDGIAPSKQDWSHPGDPEGRWPRANSDSFRRAVGACAQEDGVRLSAWAPHLDDPEHRSRRAWHEAQFLNLLPDGRAESVQGSPVVGSKIEEMAARWNPTDAERSEIEMLQASPDPGPYCDECFHGRGCGSPQMSYWQFAVEVIGGLQVRKGGDSAATRTRRNEYGRNRQMVTAGAADAFPTPSDPAAGSVIETIEPRR